MDAQTLIAGGLVAGCSAWAAWLLLPARPRAWLLARLGLEAPAATAGAHGGCSGCAGCGGCGGCGSPAPPASTPQGVTIVKCPRA